MWQGRSTWSAVCNQSRLTNQSWIYGLKISSCWIFEHLTYERMLKWLVLLIIKRGPERRLTQFNLSGNFQLKLTLTQNASGKFAGSRASSRLKSTSTLKKKNYKKKIASIQKANRVFQGKTITTRLRKILPFTSPLFVIFYDIATSHWNSLLRLRAERKTVHPWRKSAVVEAPCCETPRHRWPHTCNCAFYSALPQKYHKLSPSCSLNKLHVQTAERD